MAVFVARDGFLVNTQEPQAWLDEAMQLVQEGNYKEALAQSLKALSWYQTWAATAANKRGEFVCYMGECMSLHRVGEIYVDRKEWKKAMRSFKEAWAAFKRALLCEEECEIPYHIDVWEHEKRILFNLAIIHGRLGQNRKSLELAEKVLSQAQQIGDQEIQIKTLRLAANANYGLGRKKDAVKMLEKAAVLAREIGDIQQEEIIDESIEDMLGD